MCEVTIETSLIVYVGVISQDSEKNEYSMVNLANLYHDWGYLVA